MCSAFSAFVAVEEPGEQSPVRYNFSVLTGRLGTEHRDRYHRIAHGPGRGKSRFDHGVDEAQPLVETRERAFHRVDRQPFDIGPRSEEHTSELQSHVNLVCRLLLEKKKNKT